MGQVCAGGQMSYILGLQVPAAAWAAGCTLITHAQSLTRPGRSQGGGAAAGFFSVTAQCHRADLSALCRVPSAGVSTAASRAGSSTRIAAGGQLGVDTVTAASIAVSNARRCRRRSQQLRVIGAARRCVRLTSY